MNLNYQISVSFQYGKESIEVRLPQSSIIAFPQVKEIIKIKNEISCLQKALRNPFGPSLKELAESKKNAVIVIPDRTRPLPIAKLLPVILDELNAGEISDLNIKAIIALGTHRLMTKAEIYEMVGQDVLSRIEVINHAWNNPDVLITLEQTENGTWIDVNKIVYEADLLVGLSSVKPHRAAGWSGGAKIIDPGVCGKRTINGTHYLSIQYSIEEIMGVLENPIQKEIRKVAKMTGLDFSINAVVNKNDEVVNIFAGDFILAHRRAAEFAATIFRDPQSEKADFMICGAGEWGLDFWSAVQSIFLAEYLLKDGGTIVFFARCPEGLSPQHPQIQEFGYRLISKILELVKKERITDLAAAGHIIAVSRIIKEKKIECILISEGISKAVANSIGLNWESNPQVAVDYIFKKHGSIARGYLFKGRSVTDTVVIPW
jgi:nickel-dependent lactate racemase